MLHLLAKAPVPAVETTAPTASAEPTSAPVLITEEEVSFNTAVALGAPAAAHRHWQEARFIAAVRHIHVALPERHPVYPRRDGSYFEDARMSRLMEHL
jgi:hypothetical protein